METAEAPALPALRQRLRTLSYLFFGGGALGAAAVVFFPLPPGTNVPGTLVTIGLALAGGSVLFTWSGRLPDWVVPAALALGTLVISLDIYFAGDIRTNDEMFYLWVSFYGFYFLTPREALGQLLLIAAAYAAAIGLRDEPDPSTRLMILMGTLAMAGALTARLVRQLQGWAGRSKQREQALRQAEERFRSAFDDAGVGMALVDLEGRWIRVNEALARLTGYPADELVGKRFRELTPEDELPRDLKALDDLISGRISVHHAEKRYVRVDGNEVWVSLTVSLVRGPAGEPLHLISQMQDISDRKAAERELVDRALHDPLTRLPNRVLFLDRVGMALKRIERQPSPVAVFFIDLDRFKLINDSLGHSVGDRILVEVAGRLRAGLRPNDTVSRFGGDEFTILCENTDEEAAQGIATRIRASLSEPFEVDRHELFVTASIGASICRDHRIDPEAMLRDADAAMYRAKDDGRSRFVIFDGDMHARASEQLALENDLRRALAREELRLHYQPMVELASGRIFGVEALLRWQHPTRGLLAPGAFMRTAEESGLIVPIGEWVLLEACRQAGRWQRAGHELMVSINLSPRQLAERSLTNIVAAAIAAGAVDPARVCLEITENAAVNVAPLSELKALGVQLALDDFGTGFSSLNQVRRLPPVDTLKIDRSFVEELEHTRADTAIAAAIIGIAGALGLTAIAEGIEEVSQARALRELGCERGQGFLFHRPAPPEAIEQLLSSPPLAALRA
jgi:diguanylate cyclase (GGDEF)-like protein/PAS domain S-box-containing protein